MSNQTTGSKSIWALFKQAISGSEAQDFTKGSLRRAVFLLAVPMVLEWSMEGIFALVDIYFVGRLDKPEAVATVGLTESVLTIVYSMAIGLSVAATAMVARRIGEKNPDAAAKAGIQSAILAILFAVVLSISGVVFAVDILRLMGAKQEIISIGSNYTRIVYGNSIIIILLHLINGIFRGSGDASMAMRSLMLANICNILLCPLLIYGLGPIPALGLTGAAIATTIGRGIGVLYQLYHLFGAKRIIKFRLSHLVPDWKMIGSIFNIAWTGTLQYLIGSASWIVLLRIINEFGATAVAGYTLAVRIFIFCLLPAWGMSNAAATLVGQNLGAMQPERAEQSVWKTAWYNTIFMIFVTIIFLVFAQPIVQFMNKDVDVEAFAVQALRIISIGYILYGIGMVVINAFNGAGDTKTPTYINLFCFWLLQIPLAYLLAMPLAWGTKGVFVAILITEAMVTISAVIIFRRGKWKKVKV